MTFLPHPSQVIFHTHVVISDDVVLYISTGDNLCMIVRITAFTNIM